MMRSRGGDGDSAFELLDAFEEGRLNDNDAFSDVEAAIQHVELLQAVLTDQERAEVRAGVGAPSKPGTIQWYRENRHQPVAAGCELTIYQAAYCLLRSKLQGKTTDKSFAGLVHLAARGGLCPKPNNMPRCDIMNLQQP